MDPRSIVEALIFASGDVLRLTEIQEVFQNALEGPKPTRQELEHILETLQREWEERGGGIHLAHVADGYELRTRPEIAPWIQLLNRSKPHRLSTPAIETLAMIAYRQPITRTEIEAVRGVDSGGVLKSLLERRLIRTVGRKEEPGRPILYATSKEFLEIFGLKDLNDLPPLSEFEEMIKNQVSEEKPAEQELSATDLITNVEEEMVIEEKDREVLQELDQSLKSLKDLEKLASEQRSTQDDTGGGEIDNKTGHVD